MKITLNGKQYGCSPDTPLPALLQQIKADPEKVAVVINGKIVPREEFSSTKPAENDNIDVIIFAGGG